jgi:hypothetical protein
MARKKRGRKRGQKVTVAPLPFDHATASALQTERRYQDRVLADRAEIFRIIRDRGIVTYMTIQLHNNRGARNVTKTLVPDAAKCFGVGESHVRAVWKNRASVRRQFRKLPVKLLHG